MGASSGEEGAEDRAGAGCMGLRRCGCVICCGRRGRTQGVHGAGEERGGGTCDAGIFGVMWYGLLGRGGRRGRAMRAFGLHGAGGS